ncbi:Ku protein [Amycolatopsis sp. 195334CR]|uniref:non-homologous end joining protein Ku n=1 Tax=Amycolatopsis sp. 195334CR TaxID=2814588 RepID=UPI001A8D3356|nr:Ku protein [Amycolatopsis sp. 195334CR]MBN6033392.1 Ku protein [Amycolatopsis sp. 195334CR]
MRAVWKGTIGFGAYAIPVKAYSATTDRASGLTQVHLTDGGRIQHRRYCEADGTEVPPGEVGKGFPLPGGDVVVLTDDDLASLPLATAHSIDVLSFVPMEQVDPVYFARTYYLEPEVAGTKAYVLLSEAMQQAGRVMVVKVALRQRETLAVIRVRDQLLLLETMLWPDEVRAPDFPFQHEDVDVHVGEVRLAARLIDRLAGDFEPENYVDHYQSALNELITAKAEGGELARPAAAVQNAGVTALLAALQSGAEIHEGGSPVERARGAAEKAAEAAASAKRAAQRKTETVD